MYVTEFAYLDIGSVVIGSSFKGERKNADIDPQGGRDAHDW